MSLEKLFSDEELEAIEEMAYHGFSYSEIGEVIPKPNTMGGNLTVYAFHSNDHDAYKAYRKGFLRSQLELRQRIFLDAKHGSSPAQALAMKILDHAEYKLNSE